MISYLIQLGAPQQFYRFCGFFIPFGFVLSAVALSYGMLAGLFWVPADYQQGDAFRIIYVHVPCAMLSMLVYLVMAISSFVFLVWRIKVADLVAISIAPLGAFFTVCALVTGALWGKPMWGTYWIWDARITSELILLFLYSGYIALYQAIRNPKTASKIAAILAIVGAIDLPIIHYSVKWWTTLHQGPTISQWAKPTIESSMLKPLLAMLLGLSFYTIAVSAMRIRTLILSRQAQSQWIKTLLQ